MLTMSDIKCIKLLRNQKGLSISKIAETLHKLFFEKFVPRFTYKEKRYQQQGPNSVCI